MNFAILSAKCELPLYRAAVRESAWRMDFSVLELDALCAPTTYDHDYGGLKRALEWGPGGYSLGGGNQPGAF